MTEQTDRTMVTRLKAFSSNYLGGVEDEINSFLEVSPDREIVAVALASETYGGDNGTAIESSWGALLTYREPATKESAGE